MAAGHKLGVLKIDGVEADLDFGDYDVGITQSLVYLGTQAVATASYVDHSSITEWDELILHTGKDYKFVRNEIKTLVVTVCGPTFANWDGLTADEKKIAARYVCCPISKVIEQYGADTQLILDNYDSQSTIARNQRYQASRMYVFEKMDLTDAKNILKDAGPTIELYLGGIEGTVEDDGVEGLFDYIQARTQSSHWTTGFATQSYIPTNGPLQDVIDGMMDILENGNY